MRESSIYRELNTKKVGDAPSSDIDLISKDVHIQQSNQTELLELDLINRVTMRDGGPIPGTFQVIQKDYSDATTETILTPGNGEVWLYIGSSRASATIASGSITYRLLIKDNVNDQTVCICSEASSSSGKGPLWEQNVMPLPIYIDENASFRLQTSGSFSALETQHGFMRVR